MKGFYSVPSYVRKHSLEQRLRTILRGNPHLTKWIIIASILFLGILVSALVVQANFNFINTPHYPSRYLSPRMDIVASAKETVTLPNGITVRMRGFFRHDENVAGQAHKLWDVDGKPLPLQSEWMEFNGHMTDPKTGKPVMEAWMEVWVPAGLDKPGNRVSISSSDLQYTYGRKYPFDSTKPHQYFSNNVNASVRISCGEWKTKTIFDANEKFISGSPMQLEKKKRYRRHDDGYLRADMEFQTKEEIVLNSDKPNYMLEKEQSRLITTDISGKEYIMPSSFWSSSDNGITMNRSTTYEYRLDGYRGKIQSFPKMGTYRIETRSETHIGFQGWTEPKE
jgi:hypothetical protein